MFNKKLKRLALQMYKELYQAERLMGGSKADRVSALLHRYEDYTGAWNGESAEERWESIKRLSHTQESK